MASRQAERYSKRPGARRLFTGATVALAVTWSLLPRGAAAQQEVFPVKDDAATRNSLEQSVAYLASLPEETMLALVPEQSGIFFTDCPNCDKGTQDRGNFDWTPERPHEIRCKDCGAVYSGNSKYPDEGVLVVQAPGGVHRYPYHERPSDKYRIFFRAHADYWAREYLADKCRDFAKLYALTGDESQARRAAAILLRFAQVYPGYAYHFDYPFQEKRFAPYTQNRIEGVPAYRTARWSWWAYMDVSLELAEAYRHVRGGPPLKAMAGGAAVEKIERDLLGAMGEFVLGFEETYSNMSPGMWRDVILTGRVLQRPKWVHEAVRRFEQFLQERFLYDGHWMETAPSYCSQVIGGLQIVLDATKAHSDPPGYTDAKAGRRFDDLDLSKDTPQYALATRALLAPRFPDGRLIPVNDTWWTNGRGARESMEPVLLPGLGVAVMGGGQSDRQYHAYLDFTSGVQHKHADALSLGLFAFGKELLADIGYTHTKDRAWANCTMSHNTVVVNGLDSLMDPDWAGNRVRAFAADGKGVHVADVASVSAYTDTASRYRRTLLTIGQDSADCYLIDVFQVGGGKQHDYLLHGSADDDSTAQTEGVELKPFVGTLLNPGVAFVAPNGESDGVGRGGGYGFVHSLASGRPDRPFALDFRLAALPEVGTRTWLLPEADTEGFLGQAPSVCRAGSSDSELGKYQAPFFCARRTGDSLSSTFVAVHEPVKGTPHVATPPQVERGNGSVFVTLDRGDLGRDYAVIATDGPVELTQRTPDGDLSFAGRYAFLRTRNGKVTEAHLVGGSRLKLGDFVLEAAPSWQGQIRAVTRERRGEAGGYFEVAETIPPAVVGLTLIVTHADDSAQAYQVVSVEPSPDGGTRVFVREDPGFKLTAAGKTRKSCFPLRTIDGPPKGYEVLNLVSRAAP
ncbi:MAG: hypothetical protein AUJ96_02625 [Armatimonadetes bacterium CG2_30_66_41]|nr:hypothetical protein [Armatimonadota bacterium]OIP11267.1 MAG: hypothetical protein AUJ96_02625 [Armatimonadetes bacterium CG2_30_66_41]